MSKKYLYHFGYTGDFEMRATTLPGIENLLADELLKTGAKNIRINNRIVSFEGDIGFLYKVHLVSALSIKILIPIFEFECRNDSVFYNHIHDFPWEEWISPEQSFLFECVGEAGWLNNRMYGAMKAKDALCDRLRKATGSRPSVDKISPDRYFYVHVLKDKCTLFVNATGEVLHRRGYRKQQGKAPLNELLAAALIRLSEPEGRRCFVDGMCGSGTLGIEACLNILKIPPGIFREHYAFMDFPDFNEELWNKIMDSKTERINEPDGKRIFFLDITPIALKKAISNVRAAKLEDVVILENKDFFSSLPPCSSGILYLNPPYGKRMEVNDIGFFKQLGSRLKHYWKGWEAWMVIPERAYSAIGLRHKKRIKTLNGNIPVYLCGYELF